MTTRASRRSKRSIKLLLIFTLAVTAACSQAAVAAAASTTKSFSLDLTQETFTPTGIVLAAGSTASITVTGDGKCGAGSDCPVGASGGAGQTCGDRELGALTPGEAGPSIPYGAVAARVGSGAAVVVGPSGTVTGPGELQLIYADCVGYYGDNTGSYTVTVTYSSSSSAPGSSFTAVECTISTVSSSSCTAEVAGYASGTALSPTGTVTFTARSGSVGSACTLAPTPGSPGISSCTVSYVPSASLTAGTPPPVSAHYSGDSHFGPSSGESSFTPRSVVLFEDLTVAEETAVADGGSAEGIPVVLTNTNPFEVSADEELTVSGDPEVANSSALEARTQTIGKVSVKLAPLKTLRTKLKLTRGGVRLLDRHKHLKAVLVVRTKRAGKPGLTTRHKLRIRS